MRNTVILTAVAGLASAAAAQTASFSIVPSMGSIDWTMTTTFTLDVYASSDVGTHIAGGEFALACVGGSSVLDMVGSASPWGALGENDRGHTGGGNYAGLVFGQLIFPPFIAPSVDSALSGSVLVGSVQVTIDASAWFSIGTIDWTIVPGQGAFMLEVYDENTGGFVQFTDATGGSASMNFIPAPSSMALLGLGGLAATRRRR